MRIMILSELAILAAAFGAMIANLAVPVGGSSAVPSMMEDDILEANGQDDGTYEEDILVMEMHCDNETVAFETIVLMTIETSSPAVNGTSVVGADSNMMDAFEPTIQEFLSERFLQVYNYLSIALCDMPYHRRLTNVTALDIDTYVLLSSSTALSEITFEVFGTCHAKCTENASLFSYNDNGEEESEIVVESNFSLNDGGTDMDTMDLFLDDFLHYNSSVSLCYCLANQTSATTSLNNSTSLDSLPTPTEFAQLLNQNIQQYDNGTLLSNATSFSALTIVSIVESPGLELTDAPSKEEFSSSPHPTSQHSLAPSILQTEAASVMPTITAAADDDDNGGRRHLFAKNKEQQWKAELEGKLRIKYSTLRGDAIETDADIENVQENTGLYIDVMLGAHYLAYLTRSSFAIHCHKFQDKGGLVKQVDLHFSLNVTLAKRVETNEILEKADLHGDYYMDFLERQYKVQAHSLELLDGTGAVSDVLSSPGVPML